MTTTKKLSIAGAAVFIIVLIAYQFTGQDDPSMPRIEAKAANTLSKLPDFAKIADVKEKKETFFNTLYPILEEEEKHILKLRKALIELNKISFGDLTPKQLAYISDVAVYYRLDAAINKNTLNALLKRVDIIPPSLALTQAAIESGWGSSRFSKQGNNLFGQWCFSKGCGMVPSSRDSGKAHEVAKFSSINTAVRAYLKNLNTNSAYQALRDKRAQIRKTNGEITGISLAQTLINYSEEREKYITKVTSFIKQNKLQRFNKQFQDSLDSAS